MIDKEHGFELGKINCEEVKMKNTYMMYKPPKMCVFVT